MAEESQDSLTEVFPDGSNKKIKNNKTSCRRLRHWGWQKEILIQEINNGVGLLQRTAAEQSSAKVLKKIQLMYVYIHLKIYIYIYIFMNN